MDILTAIRKRRSVRAYTNEPVPWEHLETIVDAARLAPTGHNKQPWDFIVIQDGATRATLAASGAFLKDASAIIAVVMDPEAEYWKEDGSAAIENMMLVATALGYGSCWVEGAMLPHEATFKELLSIPASRRLLALISIGPTPAWPDARPKRSLRDVLHRERYGQKDT